MEHKSLKMRVKAILTLLGGILIHLTLGTLYTASNITTYVISYLHVVKGQKVYNYQDEVYYN